MKEFRDIFMKVGFPKTNNNITDIYDIINMYHRDIFTNKKFRETNLNENAER